jgi:hypothetical protein
MSKSKNLRKIKVYFKTEEDIAKIAKKLNLPLSKDIRFCDENGNTKPAKPFPKKEVFKEPLWVDADMPEYIMGAAIENVAIIEIIFDMDKYTLQDLKDIFEQNITEKSSYIKYPKADTFYVNDITLSNKRNKYPIYIPSKGRWDVCKTAQYFTAIKADFYIIVEEQEYDKYLDFYPAERLLILPKEFQENYETLDDLGLTKPVGPGAARNFAWEHSIQQGYDYHWVFDDNIERFFYYNDNEYSVAGDTGFLAVPERFIECYDNIGMCSIQYDKFVCKKSKNKPYVLNTRMYSMILIKNSLPYRWRGRYNEDTIISLDLLTNGISTVEFIYIQGAKMTTQILKGGNSETFYFKEGTLPKSMMLVDEYPDIAELKYKFQRWHHQVNYKQFAFNPGNLTEVAKTPFGFKSATKNLGGKTLNSDRLAEVLKSEDYKKILAGREKYKTSKEDKRTTKKNIDKELLNAYLKGYFTRDIADKNALIYGNIPRDVDLDVGNDYNIINYNMNPEVAKWCYHHRVNMYDIEDLKEALKLSDTIIVYGDSAAYKKFKVIAEKLNKEIRFIEGE